MIFNPGAYGSRIYFFGKEGEGLKMCHVCKTECEDFTELCPVCGADLTAEDETVPEVSKKECKKPVLLATMEDVVSSEILRDLLREAGIPYTCDSEGQATVKVMFGGTLFSDDLYVDESDYDRASEIYEAFLASEPTFEDGDFENFEEE